MEKLINQNYKVITGRISVPANTPVNAPVSLVLSAQNPILADIKGIMSGVTLSEFGFVISAGGQQIYPAIGSNGDANFSDAPMWASLYPGLYFESGEMNLIIPGPPYELNFQFYNKGASPAVVFLALRTTAKIDLPNMGIQKDELLKKDDS